MEGEMQYNKPYESELKPYSPESVREGLKNPNLVEPDHEELKPYERPNTK